MAIVSSKWIVSDQIQDYLPNVGHLYNEGLLREGTTLDGLSNSLAMQVVGNEGSVMQSGILYES